MAQFGTGKNPPWARATGEMTVAHAQNLAVASLAQQQVTAPMLTQPGIATPTIYSLGGSQPQMAPQQQFQPQLVQPQAMPPAVLPQPGIAIPTTLATSNVGTVSYPTPRAAQPSQTKQRVFTGTVTKLHDNFGFVDEDVFFQTSCVKGAIPKVGDRVLVEATYNANMPFKWNATRIQLLPNQGGNPLLAAQMSVGRHERVLEDFGGAGGMPGHGAPSLMGKPPGMVGGPTLANLNQPPPPLMGTPAQPTSGLLPQPPGPRPNMGGSSRRQDLPYRERERDRPRERDRDRDRNERVKERRPSPRKRSRSPRRSRSPSSRTRSPQRSSRRPARIVPRYMVQVPKLSLDTKEGNVIALRSRYQNLYIPSDFFHASFSWVEAFPLHRNFQMGHFSSFHVMHKEVQSVDKHDAQLEPSDADHLFSAKVMLLAMPTIEELFHKSCALAQDASDARESFQHPTRLIQFLVGLKGKSEPMAIGGPWSPSLDGPNPAEDPRVLIKTAIRTTRALTGIDLNNCTQWYRFAEIRYHRPEEIHKGRLVPARVETVVIFLPDVWSCIPSRLEWEALQTSYKKQLSDKIAAELSDDTQIEEEEEENGETEGEKKDPTHYTELDPKNMKVADLRHELECRSLSTKGLKSQLIARLTKATKTEQEKEEEEANNKEEEEETKVEEPEKPEAEEKDEEKRKKEEEERKRKEERERAQRERRYNLPENPSILVHPHPTAKSGKFDCTVMSLSVLLDYRPEDNKEHSFEVSLFAELFNEMLMRDFGFTIYKSLVMAPEKKEDEKKDKKDHKDKRDHKDDKKDKDDKKEDKKDKDDGDKEEKKDRKDKDKEKEEHPSPKRRKTEDDDKDEKDSKDSKDSKDREKEKSRDDKKSSKDRDKDKKSKDKDRRDDDRHRDKDDDDDEDDDDDDKDDGDKHDKKRDKLKYITEKPALLLAFVYFDQTHTGYLLDKDVEEIMHTLGLHLSRAQIKKLVQKLVMRDTLNYRKLTDKPAPRGVKEGEEDDSSQSEDKSEDGPDWVTLSQGNRTLLLPSKKDTEGGETESKMEGESQTGMILHNGAVLDIDSIMQRLEKSEKTRITLESKLKDTTEEMEELRTSFSSSEQNGQKVSLELQELKKKLRDQRRVTDSAEKESRKLTDMLGRSRSALSGLVSDMSKVLGDSDSKDKDKSEKDSKDNIKSDKDIKKEVNGEN